ncbi:MAG: sigma 54-interacting transcriptional regulator [Bacteroidota bacterium]
MGQSPQTWNRHLAVRTANALEQALMIVDAELNILHQNYCISNLLSSKKYAQAATIVVAQIPKLTWQIFVDSQQSYLRLGTVFLQQQSYEVIAVRAEAAFLLYLNLVDDEQQQIRQELAYLLTQANQTHNPDEIVGKASVYLDLLYQVEQIADTEAVALLIGETGTGKELIARMLYRLSDRYNHPFFKINCAALPNAILERHLFGTFDRRTRTNAKSRKGILEIANSSTVYLDKVDALSIELQAKIARLLQDGTYEAVGATSPRRTEVRFLASTTKNLQTLVDKGFFRKDLYFLLRKFPLEVPSLRRRKEDISLLVAYFQKKYAKKRGKAIKKPFSKTLRRLMQYDFPGNVRELENLVERAVLLTQNGVLNLEAVLPDVNTIIDEKGELTAFLNFEEMQRQHILNALKKTNWRVSGAGGAAELLALNPKTLVSKMKKLRIERKGNM